MKQNLFTLFSSYSTSSLLVNKIAGFLQVLHICDIIGLSKRKEAVSINKKKISSVDFFDACRYNEYHPYIGVCYENGDGTFSIEFSGAILYVKKLYVNNTIIHELIHTIPKYGNHGKWFKKYVKKSLDKFGIAIETCMEDEMEREVNNSQFCRDRAQFIYCLMVPPCTVFANRNETDIIRAIAAKDSTLIDNFISMDGKPCFYHLLVYRGSNVEWKHIYSQNTTLETIGKYEKEFYD